MSASFLGIDIGGTTVKAAQLRDQRVLWTGQSDRYSRPNIEHLIAAVRQACAQASGPIERVGICVPGLLDETGQRVTFSANVPGLMGISLGDLVTPVAGARPGIVVVNDANAAAFDIHCTRKIAGRLLVLTLGTGVGASVLDDGKPLFVDGQSPGHIGQIDVSLEGEDVIAPDGGRGGLEGYIGAAALAARYGPDPSSRIHPGHPAFRALVRAIRICHAIYRPHHVCLAGGLGIRLGRLLDALRSAINEDLTGVARPGWVLSTGDSDFHAAAGAARIANSAAAWPTRPSSPSPSGRGSG